MKKILGLAISAIIIMAIAGAGTYAYFNDTETSNTNTITAGTLALSLNGGYSNVNILTGLTNKAPGDSSSNNMTIQNTGSIDGRLNIQTGAVTNTAGTGAGKYDHDGSGDLGANAQIAPWIDVNGNGTFDGSDIALKSDNTTYLASANSTMPFDYVNNFGSKTWLNVQNPITAGTSEGFQINWRIGTSVNNTIQGDSISFDITFVLEQAAAD